MEVKVTELEVGKRNKIHTGSLFSREPAHVLTSWQILQGVFSYYVFFFIALKKIEPVVLLTVKLHIPS